MRNEIPVEAKETEKDDSSFTEASNTRVLEMSLVSYNKMATSIQNNSEDVRADKIQAPFSTIFKDKDVLNDGDVFY